MRDRVEREVTVEVTVGQVGVGMWGSASVFGVTVGEYRCSWSVMVPAGVEGGSFTEGVYAVRAEVSDCDGTVLFTDTVRRDSNGYNPYASGGGSALTDEEVEVWLTAFREDDGGIDTFGG
ncbi:hypothetical protein OS965_38705 [Streptomyces sp. H27-G5]|uniref:hypothetical protein n=1 Tax=Streptomyces sp. H27-G5 TaxID=2996698 RepID=UPI00226F1546|nr:hypothetical protein [Streptomyces sp. H27-G5]MCY0923994.1 hypothetical protein [Streptomyces sp. H27-G5]